MNRGTVVLLALAILLAHTLGIHQTSDGNLAAPYEVAHVAYRLGRNLVYEGAASWNPGGEVVESYPSAIWVGLSALSARLYLSPIAVSQAVGMMAALATVLVLAQFSPKRSSGLIGPLLLAASGSAAASALSGTETSLVMLLVTLAFLAFERGKHRTLSTVLVLLVLARPEGAAIAALLFTFEVLWRPRGEHARRPARREAYLAPCLVAVGGALVRHALTGRWLSPFAAPLLVMDLERWRLGAEYLSGFVVCSGFLLLFPTVILSLAAGRSSATGTRALALASLWCVLVLLSGGDGLPFWNALVPMLPLFFLGVQECLRVWIDQREWMARPAWIVLLASVVGAFLVSKVPGDIGPLRLEGPLTAWQTPRGKLARAFPRMTGRMGLLDEVRTVEHLRTLGVFLRDRVGADAVILTSWPGAIGYLSRKEVLDLTGRVWPLPGQTTLNSWRGISRVNVVDSLSDDVDYVVPVIGTLSETEAPADFLLTWLERYDSVGATAERAAELLKALRNFELVSVPVPARSHDPREPAEQPFPLLQRKGLGLVPSLSLETEGRLLRVLVRHDGPQQVVDLCVRLSRRGEPDLYLRPTGNWTDSRPVDARTSLLVFASGSRSILFVEARVPEELGKVRLTAFLHNPGMSPLAPLSQVGQPAKAEM